MTLEQRIRVMLKQGTSAGKSADEIIQESVEEVKGKKDVKEDETININVASAKKPKGQDDDAKNDDPEEADGDAATNSDDDDKTDVAKDPGTKDKVAVKEDQDVALPGESKKVTVGDKHGTDSSEGGKAKNAKIEKDHSDKEIPPGTEGGVKLKNTAEGAGDGNDGQTSADNAKIKKGQQQDPKKGLTMKEHVDAMFAGQKDLSEEFKSKATTIFEAAVNDAAKARFDELKEEHEQQLAEAVAAVKSELEEQVDGYLGFVVEQWVKDNQVALERGIKEELVTDFIDGLKKLFKENYVEIPEDKVDVIAGQATKIDELEASGKKLAEDNEKLVKEVASLKRKGLIESVGKDLTDTQREKFAGLVEAVEYTSDDEFSGKIKTIKESYFRDGKEIKSEIPAADKDKPVLTEDSTNSAMEKYTKALGKPLKFV